MKKIWFIVIVSLLSFAGCSGNANEEENSITTESTTKEDTCYVEGDIPQELIEVLLNDAEFVDTQKDNKRTKLSEFTYADNEQVLNIVKYAIVDTDNDGYNEIVAYLDAYVGLVEIFHFEDGEVYGYQFGDASFKEISMDGVFKQVTTASEMYNYRLEFHKEKSTSVILSYVNNEDEYYISDKNVSEQEYKEYEEKLYREKATLYTDLNLLSEFAGK